jgi:deazaflavin-dependent oxidoreductase (nitroreductase family)
MKALTWLGLSPRHVLIETTGRVSGKHRRTIVGAHRDGATLWIVAEQGRHAGYVRNLEATPAVRLRLRARWRNATATVLDDDDPIARLATFGGDKHAGLVQKFGTSLLTIRIDLSD